MPRTAYTLCCCFFDGFCNIITLIFTLYTASAKSSIRFFFNTTIYDIKSLLLCPTFNGFKCLLPSSKCLFLIQNLFRIFLLHCSKNVKGKKNNETQKKIK